MKKLILFFLLILNLCACEEMVPMHEYNAVEAQMLQAEELYEDLLQRRNEMKEQCDLLENRVCILEENCQQLENRARNAEDKVSVLCDEYNSCITGHWALDFRDIATDAEDVKRALEGAEYRIKIRTKNGIEY